MIGVGSAPTLLLYAVALVVLLFPQPCAPASPGNRFTLCSAPTLLPLCSHSAPTLAQGFWLALVASALTMLLALATVYHSLISQKRGFAALLGVGALSVSLLFALSPLISGSTLLAIVTLLSSVAPSGGQRRGSLLDATPADHVE